MPPGSATNASDSSAISALRSCIESTTLQLGQAAVADLAVDQRLRHHADHLAAGGQRGVGEHAHQADVAAAVDEPDAALREHGAERPRRVCVGGIVPGLEPA